MRRPERHHIAPYWELFEYRNGRWAPVPRRRMRRPPARSKPKPDCGAGRQNWVMRKAAYLLAEMIKQKEEHA